MDTWGGSWGSAWGDSWGLLTAATRTKGGVSTRESFNKIRERNKRLLQQIQRDDEEVLALLVAIRRG